MTKTFNMLADLDLYDEVVSAADRLELEVEDATNDELCIQAAELGGFTDREYENFCERKFDGLYKQNLDAAWLRLGYANRDDFINGEFEKRRLL